VTDGSGLNLNLHGQFAPDLYGLPGAMRRATTEDYDHFEALVSGAVERAATACGWHAHQWSTVRASLNNVCYQTFEITRSSAQA
jgi:hypothetical protein